jgi:hypothetical protein
VQAALDKLCASALATASLQHVHVDHNVMHVFGPSRAQSAMEMDDCFTALSALLQLHAHA